MATWQFDFHMLPAKVVSSFYQSTPLTIPRADFESQEWCKDIAAPANLRDGLTKFLSPLRSWSSNVERWGCEEGNRIDITWDNGAIAAILARVDVRNLSHVFLVHVLELARKNDWLLRTQDGRVFRSSLTRLLSAI